MNNAKLKKSGATLAITVAIAAGSVALTSSPAFAESWEPEEQLNITIAFGPGVAMMCSRAR